MLRNLVVLALVFLTACEPDAEVVSEGDYLVFEAIGAGQTGAIADTTEWLVRDSVDWGVRKAGFSPREPFPAVRFGQEMVIAIALPQESGGFNIEVESIEETADELIVEYAAHVPAADCIPLVGESLPFQVIRVRRSDKPARFVRRDEPYRCTWKQ